jgi:hypothetical protein
VSTTKSKVGIDVSVNEDGPIVWTTDSIHGEDCLHTFDPLVLSRAMSLAIAKAVLAAQEGGAP